ncbi:hypothetical protein D3C75_983040 [compost metagenome]
MISTCTTRITSNGRPSCSSSQNFRLIIAMVRNMPRLMSPTVLTALSGISMIRARSLRLRRMMATNIAPTYTGRTMPRCSFKASPIQKPSTMITSMQVNRRSSTAASRGTLGASLAFSRVCRVSTWSALTASFLRSIR